MKAYVTVYVKWRHMALHLSSKAYGTAFSFNSFSYTSPYFCFVLQLLSFVVRKYAKYSFLFTIHKRQTFVVLVYISAARSVTEIQRVYCCFYSIIQRAEQFTKHLLHVNVQFTTRMLLLSFTTARSL